MPGQQDFGPYVQALLAEWALIGPYQPYTLYIGGGTPSILPISQLQRLVHGLEIDMTALQEATIEANPEDVTPEWLHDIKRIGFSRVSMGVQSLRDPLLQAIGRRHSALQARHAVKLLQESGLEYSIDLIYGLPGQSLDVWDEDLHEALAWRPPHISCYLLSYEPGTRLYAQLMAGKVEETPEQLASEMYQALCLAARQNGYHHYEISNFALHGHHAVHNSRYWDGTPYIGLGASAHSFDGSRRWSNPHSIKKYIDSLSRGHHPRVIENETIIDRVNDTIITRLRTSRGLSLGDFSRDFGPQALATLLHNAAPLLHSGSVLKQGTPAPTLTIPESHWLIADAILRDLIFDQ